MAYTYSFMDNGEYSAADVNAAISSLVTSGIEDPFADGVPYNATKLNEIIHAVSSAGVVPETDTSCKCSIDTEANTVSIMAGTAFFNDGSRIVFDAEGETLEYTPGVKNYVYLKASPSENRNYPECSTTEPSGDVVMLAEIDADGVLTDKRVYARGKLPGYQSNVDTVMHVNDSVVLNNIRDTHGAVTTKYETCEYTIHMGTNNYTRVLYEYCPSSGPYVFGLYNIETGIHYSAYTYASHQYSYSSTTAMNAFSQYENPGAVDVAGCIAFKKDGKNLVLTISIRPTYHSYEYKYVTVPLTFTLF